MTTEPAWDESKRSTDPRACPGAARAGEPEQEVSEPYANFVGSHRSQFSISPHVTGTPVSPDNAKAKHKASWFS